MSSIASVSDRVRNSGWVVRNNVGRKVRHLSSHQSVSQSVSGVSMLGKVRKLRLIPSLIRQVDSNEFCSRGEVEKVLIFHQICSPPPAHDRLE